MLSAECKCLAVRLAPPSLLSTEPAGHVQFGGVLVRHFDLVLVFHRIGGSVIVRIFRRKKSATRNVSRDLLAAFPRNSPFRQIWILSRESNTRFRYRNLNPIIDIVRYWHPHLIRVAKLLVSVKGHGLGSHGTNCLERTNAIVSFDPSAKVMGLGVRSSAPARVTTMLDWPIILSRSLIGQEDWIYRVGIEGGLAHDFLLADSCR
mmetsp:Transcript_2170/g.4112  ORF Transcript_2170/g.4112 Transcript_2170/m.4112 type:complete len:205 (+) Transcript_2170:3054-3668(+)